MDKQLRDEIYTAAKEWVLQAGRNIREKMNDPLIVTTKSNPNDLVTELDKQTEIFFVTKIRETFPEHRIVGEEGFGELLESLDGIVWIIDPIDGTMNFVHQKRFFAISMGIYHDGVGEIGFIYDVMTDELYQAKRNEGAYKNTHRLPQLDQNISLKSSILGLNHHFLCENTKVDEKVMQKLVRTIRGSRSFGSAALGFAYVAEGAIDGYLSLRLAPWDIAAGIIILNEVGGVTTTLAGDQADMLGVNTILSCNQSIQEELLQFMREGKK